MFHDTPALESPCADAAPEADPKALALVQALSGCCHPRAGRLTARLLACTQPEQLLALQGDVRNLLALSFGPAEADQRLQALQ
jgi:hypothetical protein